MASYRLRYGAYDLPRTFRPADDALSFEIGKTDRLRSSGAVAQQARATGRILTVSGEYTGIDLDAFLAVKDTVLQRCSDGPADLWFGRDDRYFKAAQLLTPGVSYPDDGVLYGAYGIITLSFECAAYPESFGTAAHSPALGAGGGTFSAQGDSGALALPTWTIVIDDAGTGPLTLTNTTTGEFCTIARPGANFEAGDVIVINRDGATATRNGVAVVGLWDRRIPRIACGKSNTITLTAGGTATVASLAVSYLPRFR